MDTGRLSMVDWKLHSQEYMGDMNWTPHVKTNKVDMNFSKGLEMGEICFCVSEMNIIKLHSVKLLQNLKY